MWALNKDFHLWHLLCFPLQPLCMSLLWGEPELTQLFLAVSLSAFHPEKWVLCLEHTKEAERDALCHHAFYSSRKGYSFPIPFIATSVLLNSSISEGLSWETGWMGSMQNCKILGFSIDFRSKTVSWVMCHFQHQGSSFLL